MFRMLEQLLFKIERIFTVVGCVALFAMMVMVCAETITRYVFKAPIPAYYDLLQDYIMPYTVFLTISFVYTAGHHIRIEMLCKHFPEKVNRGIMMLADALTAVVFVLIGYQGLIKTLRAYNMQEYAPNYYGYPMWTAYVVVFIGSAMLVFQLIRSVIIMRHPSPDSHVDQ